MLDESIVVLTADHGLRAELALSDAPIEIDDWTTHVPLFIRAPGLEPNVSTLDVWSVDLAATLHDLLDLDAASTLQGVSAFATERPDRTPWFVVNGRWIYHLDREEWRLVAEFPEQIEVRRDFVPCFERPSTCSSISTLPMTPTTALR